MTTARRVAFDLLTEVDEHDAYANLVLPQLLRAAKLSQRDAGFATELGYGTLRMRGLLDAVIAQVSSRPVHSMDGPVRRLLQLGAYQWLEMNVGAHAAVSETVSLSRAVGAGGAAGFVNAGLRRITERSRQEWLDRVRGAKRGPEALSIEFSHPEWIVAELRHALAHVGLESELELLLAADNAAPAVNLVSLPGVGPTPSLLGEVNQLSPIGAQSAAGNPARVTSTAGVRVQDEGSQLAALALTRALPIAPGEQWLDMCAGPGGKAAVLAAEARLAGARLEANEVSVHRDRLVQDAVSSVADVVTHRQSDARAYGQDGRQFDRILLDAPCSGLGALRRRPEARWRKQQRDVAELEQLQRELLDAGVRALAPGGLLAYVTCSPVLGETVAQIERVVRSGVAQLLDTAEHLDRIALGRVDARVSIPGSAGSAVQLWPHRHATDAMFIALLTVA